MIILTEDKAKEAFDYYWYNRCSGHICPMCGSNNSINLFIGNNFWGCKECKFGFFEQYLKGEEKEYIIDFLNLKDYSMYYTIEIKDKPIVIPKKKEVAIQLSLF